MHIFQVEFMKLDFRSLDTVNHFVETFKAKGYPLNLLVCNHAVVEVPKGKQFFTLSSLPIWT